MSPNQVVRAALVAGVLAAAVTIVPAPPAGAAASCAITQLTTSTGGGGGGSFAHISPAISQDGEVVAFASDRSPTSANADANQELFRLVLDTGVVTQLTATTGGTFANGSPAVDADGTAIVFTSNRNLGSANADGNREVFRWVGGGMITATLPITSTTVVDNSGPTVNASGNRIAFVSDGDLTGDNADGNDEIFLHRTSGPSTTQVTDTTGSGTGDPDLNAAGDVMVFVADDPIGGANPDGNGELFRLDVAAGTTTALTATTGSVESFSPAVAAGGTRVGFASDAAFAGRNADGSEEVFLRETTAGTTTALTAGVGGSFGVGEVDVNAAGTRVVFDTDDDLLGTNADGGFEVYLRDFNATGPRLVQLTADAVDSSGEVAIDGSGRRVVFTSRGDHAGDNADGNREVFLATCSAPPPPALCEGRLVTVNRERNEAATGAADVIRGRAGNDAVNGQGGPDRFCGRTGDDTFAGGPGNDRALGGDGDDRLGGGEGDDRLVGEPGADRLDGGPGPDTCLGGPGSDTAVGCTVRTGVP